ncbi:MAG: DUF2275 domain-containing protein [Nitrospiraceae bacterium]|nr:MAG: DUF2275 domain-containing protein [Nitrospiraceae bacterium]
MECRSIGEKLSAYIEDHLSSEEKLQIKEHLETCRHCRISLNDLKKTMEYTRGLEEMEPPAWLAQKVMNKIREEAGQKKGFLRRFFFPFHIKVPLEVAAMIAIVVVAVYVYKTLQPGEMLKEIPADQVLPYKEEAIGEKKDRILTFEKARLAAPEPAKRGIREQEAGIAPETGEAPAEKAGVAAPERAPDVSYRSMDTKMMEERTKSSLEEDSAYVKEKKETAFFILHVEDTERALRDLERIFKELNIENVEKEFFKGKNIITAELEPQNLNDLNEKLKSIGRIGEKKEMIQQPVGKVQVRIEILRKND